MIKKYKQYINLIFTSITNKCRYRNSKIIITNSFSELKQSNIYDDIYRGKSKGLIIHNFLTLQEINDFKYNFTSFIEKYPELIEEIDSGYTFGKSFFDIGYNQNYFILAEKYRKNITKLFTSSIEVRINDLISKISNGKRVNILESKTNERYLANNIRVFEPGKGGLHFHADLDIHNKYNAAEEVLNNINNNNVIGIFILLQKSEIGGRLLLHNLFNETGKSAIYNSINLDKITILSDKPAINEGDVIIFNAGKILHAVEPIYGLKPRITIGCFSSYSNCSDEIFVWS